MNYGEIGRLAIENGDFQEAVNIFRRSLEERRDPEGFVGLGRAYYELGDRGSALWAFNKSLELDPEGVDANSYIEKIRGLEPPAPPRKRKAPFRAGKTRLEMDNGSSWEPFIVKGVNLGLGLPGYSPGEFAVKKGTYLKWFGLMAEAGINTVRVYTLLPPHFYEALFEFNGSGQRRLYLLQGIWAELPPDGDFGGAGYTASLREDIGHAVDAVYGNAEVPERPGRASGGYAYDVSDLAAGFIFGREWESCAVKGFNDSRGRTKGYYGGRFLDMRGGEPFELWAAGMCDYLQAYEHDNYGVSRPVSLTNWPTLDPLSHPTESDYEKQLAFQGLRPRTRACNQNEDMETLDVAKISARGGGGFFATYHVYPYYPDFMNNDYMDAEDPYGAYLAALKAHHAGQPVLIGEFGVPSSRDVAHWQRLGWHQGGHDEDAQGRINSALLRTIHGAGLAGSVLFSWFDEWYKRNWLFLPYELPGERNRLWFNHQDPEQNYGLMAVRPGYPAPGVSLSGSASEWDGASTLYEKGGGGPVAKMVHRFGDGFDGARSLRRVRVRHDEGFLYILLETAAEASLEEAHYLIGLDTCRSESGETLMPFGTGLRSPVGLKYLVHIAGRERSRVLACAAYDRYLNSEKGVITPGHSDQGAWVPMRNKTNTRRISKDGTRFFPSRVFPVSPLRHGSLRRESPGYDSLADFYQSGNMIEVRLPWNLMNFTDPSSRAVLWKEGDRSAIKTEGIKVVAATYKPVKGRLYAEATGAGTNVTDHLPERLVMPGDVAVYSWKGWETPVYHTHLKDSYYQLKEALASLPGEGALR
jgi:tetratricopeptide (TPR) repeat protein